MRRTMQMLLGAGLLLAVLVPSVSLAPAPFVRSLQQPAPVNSIPVAMQVATPFATSTATVEPTRQAAATPTTAPASATVHTRAATATAQTLAQRRAEEQPTPTALPLMQRFRARPDDVVTQVRPGVVHIYRETADPVIANILLFDLTASEFDVKSTLGDGWLSGRTRTSYVATQYGALAGINGDLFAGAGAPQGMTIFDERVVIPPKRRATFAWTRDREPIIDYFTDSWTWAAYLVAENGRRVWVDELNRPCPFDGICVYNEFSRLAPYSEYLNEVKVLVGPSGRVFDIADNDAFIISPGMQVIQGIGAGADWLRRYIAISDTVTLDISTTNPIDDITQAISGGPILLQEGRFFQDCMCKLNDCSAVTFPTAEVGRDDLLCEDFDTYWKEAHYYWVYMPRTGVGYDKNKQTLIVAVVDGYQPGFSRGMLQTEFANLMREFGAYTAMELDGGGSATMVLEDEVINNPSDDTGERYVANSLLFFWHEPEQTLGPPVCTDAMAGCVQ
ncbi:MAG: phosphodiester glycosidase family protein [Chloroflexaceae bacterium]|nr:phosphodiester glycosidase family protein [Chloroflexaceae bacterium]